MKPTILRASRSAQEGVILLEAMIGILIFSLGVLALVAMQAVSISNVSNARFRSEAAFLANEIISAAWIDRGPALNNLNNYVYPGGNATPLTTWVGKVNALMPQAATYPPSVRVSVVPGSPAARQITVTVRWRAPDAIAESNHVAVGYISDP